MFLQLSLAIPLILYNIPQTGTYMEPTRKELMPLIDEVLAHAEKDLDVNKIIRYIITANPNLQNDFNASLTSHPTLDDQNPLVTKLDTFICDMYDSWFAKLTGSLFLEFDLNKYGPTVSIEANNFNKEHQLLRRKSVKYPTAFSQKLKSAIISTISCSIDPIAPESETNYVYQLIQKCCLNASNFDQAMKEMQTLNREFHNKGCQIVNSPNFIAAKEELKRPFIQYLDQKFPAVATSWFDFFSCCKRRNKDSTLKPLLKATAQNPSINGDMAATNVKPDFITALNTYISTRREDPNQYHFWGSIFSCLAVSLTEKEVAVAKLIYWKQRELMNCSNKDIDETKRFTRRDIVAIRDGQLGRLCNDYKDHLPKEFLDAEIGISNSPACAPVKYMRQRG